MNPYQVHYMNKYPKGEVVADESSLRVYDSKRRLRVAMVFAVGQWLDKSKECGALDQHDLSPLPKQARVLKINKDRHVTDDNQARARKLVLKKFLSEDGEKIQSCEELSAQLGADGVTPLWQFDKNCEILIEPKLEVAPAAPKAAKKAAPKK